MPSIFNGLFAGRAGIQSIGAGIGVLADNIANSNTTGFKASRPEFSDLLAGDVSGRGSSLRVGSGVELSAVRQTFTQGTFEFTGRSLDVGIDGDGFFVVEDATNQTYYTRAGNFNVDKDGILRDQTGYTVQGFAANGSGGLESLNVNNATSTNTVATLNVDVTGNLDASTSLTAVPGGAPTFADMANAATFSTFVDVFDSLGEAHSVTTYFFHTQQLPTAEWEVVAVVDGSEVTDVGSVDGQPFTIGSTTLAFGTDGLRTPPIPDPDFTVAPNWSSGATASPIDFSLDPFTAFAAASNIGSIFQDGNGAGAVVSFGVEDDGEVFALLDNGQKATVGTLAMAIFANPEELARQSGTLWTETNGAGDPVIGTPGTGRFGNIQTGALELSTADMAADFIRLISLQRGFQGSARIVSNIDDLLQEIVNLL